MMKENSKHTIKRILTFFLAIVLGLQVLVVPVQAASQSGNVELSTNSVEKESFDSQNQNNRTVETTEEGKETVTIIESKSDKVDIVESEDVKAEEVKTEDNDLTKNSTISQEKTTEEKANVENKSEENNLKENQDQKLTKEQLNIAKDMGLGEIYIYNLPRTNYKSGDQIDLSTIEILVKDKDGNIDLLGYDDLANLKDVEMNLHQGDKLSFNYYNPLFDEENLKFETIETRESISNYLEKNKIQEYKPNLTIKIQNYEPIKIDFTLEKEFNLSPLELFAALKMKSSSMRLLASDNLTYKGNQDIKLDGFTFLIKDEKGLLKMVSGEELENESINIDFSKLNEDKKLFKGNYLQTFIILEKENFEKLYIPVTLVSDDTEIKSIDKNSNLDFIELNQEKKENNLILTSMIDVKNLEDVKNVNLEFFKNGSDDKSQIKVLKVVKTDGNKEEDISLTTPYFRVKDGFDKYKDLSKDEISKEMKDLNILNPFALSNTLETGYKYLITLEIENVKDLTDLTTKITVDELDSNDKITKEEFEHKTEFKQEEIVKSKALPKRMKRSISPQALREANLGEFTINKVDADDKNPLQNAEFTLTDSSGNFNTKTSGIDGKIEFKNLPPDTYRLKETQAPDGYQASPKEWSVYVNSQGRTFITELGEIAPGGDSGGIIGRDVTERVVLNTANSSVSFKDSNGDGKLNVGTSENNINIVMNMFIEGSVNPGDYFVIKESDTLHYNMLQPDKPNYVDIRDANRVILAKKTYGPNFNINDGSGKDLVFVFTEAISGLKNISLSTTWGHSVNINHAQNNGSYEFGVEIGSQKLLKTFEIDHLKPATRDPLNINANYLYTNDQTGRYTQLGYINPLKKNIQGESTITAYVPKVSGSTNQADIGPGKTRVEVYKFNDNIKVPDAVVLDKSKVTLVNSSQYSVKFTEIGNNHLEAVQIILNEAIGTSTYIVVVHSEMKFPGADVTGDTILGQFIRLSNNGVYVEKASAILTTNSSAGGSGSNDYTPPTLEVENTKKVEKEGKFEIIKTGESKDELLPGAEFTLTPINPTGNNIVKSSSKEGTITFDKLKPGTYELTETKAPEGYTKTDKKWTITVDINGVTKVIENQSRARSIELKSIENRVSNLSRINSTQFNPLRVNFNSNFIQPSALPKGVQESDIRISGSSKEDKFSKVTTSATYLGNNQFEVKIDITAGNDTLVTGDSVDVVFVVQAPVLTPAIKTALMQKISQYGDNVKVGIVVYDEKTNYNASLRLLQKSDAILALNSAQATNNWPSSAVRTQYALQTANNIFENGSSQNKELIMVVGNSIGASNRGITTQVNYLKNKGVTINNFYVGANDGLVQTRMNHWNTLLQLRQNTTINASDYNTEILNSNLKVYGKKNQKSVENATFKVSFNKDFKFVGGSTSTSKSENNNGRWHSGYNQNTNSIDLYSGELTLNAQQTATMTFKVESVTNIDEGIVYPLINDIEYQPNSSVQKTTVPAPTIRVEENKLDITVKNNHIGGVPKDSSINFELKRKIGQIEDPNFTQKGSMGLTGSITFGNLPKKNRSLTKDNSSGNMYTYYLANVKSTNEKVIVTDSSGSVIGENGTLIISTKENRGFNVSVNWQGLDPIGVITGKASNGKIITLDANNKYFYEEFSANAQEISLLQQVTGPEGYTYTVSGEEGSYIIKVSKNPEIPSITVSNKKEDKEAEFVVIKTDESGNKKLQGAEFKLTGSNFEKTQSTGLDGKATFSKLKPGTYTLTETKAPTGYVKTEGSWTVKVGEDGKVSITTPKTVNPPQYTISNLSQWVAMTTSNNQQLIAFKQEIIESSGNYILRVYVDSRYSGTYLNELEIKLNTDKFDVTGPSGYSSGIFSKTINTNIAKGQYYYDFKIKPKSPQNEEVLKPVSEFKFAKIVFDSQYFSSMKASITESAGQTINLKDKGNNSFEYTISNKKARYDVEFIKVSRENSDDTINDQPLANVTFALYKKNEKGQFVDTTLTAISGNDGLFKFTSLEAGEYEIREISTPEGYILITGSAKSFKINENGSVQIKGQDGDYHDLTEDNKKIVNHKTGNAEFTIIKKDNSDKTLENVEFELYDSNGNVVKTKTTDSQGKIKFENLPFGRYWLKEKSTLPGYILDSTLIPVLLGKDWDVPQNVVNPMDVSNALDIDNTKNNGIVSTSNNAKIVYPNKGEGLLAGLNVKVKQGNAIKPGDYFTVTLSDNLDIDGVGIVPDEEFDIISKAGKLADAKVSDDRRTITYTFTEYVNNYHLTGFSVNLPMFVNRTKVKNNTNSENFAIGINNTQITTQANMQVNFDPNVSVESKSKGMITRLDNDDRKFTLYLYLNAQKQQDYSRYLEVWSDQFEEINSVNVYSTNLTVGNDDIPWSYGIDLESLQKSNKIQQLRYNREALTDRDGFRLTFGTYDGYAHNNTYIVKIDGKAKSDQTEFKTTSRYYSYIDGINEYNQIVQFWRNDTWVNTVKLYPNNSIGEGNIEIKVLNNKNKIEYTKVEGKIINTTTQGSADEDRASETDIESLKLLKDAEFQLKVQDGNTWKDYGTIVKSDEKGKFSWEGLPQGKYQVWETKAPDGYITPKDYVSSFEVDANGNIINVLNNTTIIPNEKESMKFFIDKIWEDANKKQQSIKTGTLELTLTAPEGECFPDDVKVDDSQVTDRKYKITKVSEDKKTITLEIDLKDAYEGVNSETDVNKAIKINVPGNWPSGTYTLKETKAPAGYIIGEETFNIAIDFETRTIKNGDKVLYSKTGEAENLEVLKIVNKKGEYPATGGMGTTIYTMMGLSLMAIAFLGFRRKKVINNAR